MSPLPQDWLERPGGTLPVHQSTLQHRLIPGHTLLYGVQNRVAHERKKAFGQRLVHEEKQKGS